MKRKRGLFYWIKSLIVLCVLVGGTTIGLVFIINGMMVRSTNDYILEVTEADDDFATCAVVLGARVYSDGTLSPMLRDRVDYGVKLYQDGIVDKLIMSGDNGQNNYDEVNPMMDYAVAKGVPLDDIFLDHAGFSTYESMYRAKAIFNLDKMIVVTQDYHLPRALYVAHELGVEAYGVSATPREYIGQAKRDVREVLARVKDFFMVKLDVKPTYLGESISVDGSGTVTHDQ